MNTAEQQQEQRLSKMGHASDKESYSTDSTVESSGSEGDHHQATPTVHKKRIIKIRASGTSLDAGQVQRALRKSGSADHTTSRSLDKALKVFHSSQGMLRDARSVASRKSTRSSSTGRHPRQCTNGTQENRQRAVDRTKTPGNRKCSRSVSRDRRKQCVEERKEGTAGESSQEILASSPLPPPVRGIPRVKSTPSMSKKLLEDDSIDCDLLPKHGIILPEHVFRISQPDVLQRKSEDPSFSLKRSVLRNKSTDFAPRKITPNDGQPENEIMKSQQDTMASTLTENDQASRIGANFENRETVTDMVMKMGIITQAQLDQLIAAGFLFIKV